MASGTSAALNPFGDGMSAHRKKVFQSKWGKMNDAELRGAYEKTKGRWKDDIFAEIQKRQTLGGFGQEAAGGNNVVDGDGDNRLMDIESRLAALEGGGENVMEGAGVGGSAEISGGFSDGSLDAAENIYGTEEERMAAAGASAQQTAANAAAISGL